MYIHIYIYIYIYIYTHIYIGIHICIYKRTHHKQHNDTCTTQNRMLSDCGRLQEEAVVLFTGLGLVRVKNVVSVRSTVDLESILGRNLDGLGLVVPRHKRGVEVLCDTCNMSRRLIDLGHLVLFNVEFLSR